MFCDLYHLLCLLQQDVRQKWTLTQSEYACKSEADDKSPVAAASATLPPTENIQHQSVQLAPSAADSMPSSLDTSVEYPVKFSPAVSVAAFNVNSIDYTTPQGRPVQADFASDVKPPRIAIDGDRFPNRDTAKAAVDNEAVQARSFNSRTANLSEVPAFESSQRVRWLSGVSCTSSSTSGGEESPRPGSSTKNCVPSTSASLSEWFSSNRPSQYQGQTSTPVNGWLDSTSAPPSRVLKAENDMGQLDKSSGSIDGLHSVNNMHSVSVDGISFHKTPNNSNVIGGSVPTMERLYHSGHIQDNRPWLSNNTSPESRWNSRVSVPEPFWASRSTPLQSHMTAAQSDGGFDYSHTPPSFNASLNDAMNSVQMAQNISPSTPVATTPSKKRVCVCYFGAEFSILENSGNFTFTRGLFLSVILFFVINLTSPNERWLTREIDNMVTLILPH